MVTRPATTAAGPTAKLTDRPRASATTTGGVIRPTACYVCAVAIGSTWKALAVAALVVAILASCGGDSPAQSPTPTATPAASPAAAPVTPATETPQPTPSATPTTTPRPAPTTPSPTPTTATPTATATITPPPEPTPTPTPTPEEPVEPAPTPATRPSLPPSPTFDAPPGVYTTITVGAEHACALTGDGEAVCWDIVSADVWDTPPGPYTFITSEDDDTCAITDQGQIVCWSSGGVSIPESRSDPSRDAPPGRYSALSMNVGYHYAITDAGQLICWPDGCLDPPSGTFVAIGKYEQLHALGSTYRGICALSAAAEAVCWGTIDDGGRVYPPYVERDVGYVEVKTARSGRSCGLTTGGRSSCMATEAGTGVRHIAINTSGLHDCAITEAGKAVCEAALTELWMGRTVAMTPPDPAPERFMSISVGGERQHGSYRETAYGCALTEGGRPVCWRNIANKVVPLDPAPPYVAVSDGYGHTCALTRDGQAVCWGWNNFGQLEIPQGRYKTISAGRTSTCALTVEGKVVCAGPDAPEFIPGSFMAISMRGATLCALTEEGEPICWLLGSFIETPPGPFASISVSHEAGACALTEGGEVVCWSTSDAPHVREGLYRSISGSCAITESGEPVCWDARWEDGGVWFPTSPPVGEYVAASMGSEHGCALTEAGEVRCWGALGNSREATAYGPVDAPPGRYTALSSGHHRACGLTDTGRVVCWGDNEYKEVPWWAYE